MLKHVLAIGHTFDGVLAYYADDIVLISPTANGMRQMLNLGDKYAKDFDIIFNTSKSKCIINRPRGCSFWLDIVCWPV